MDTKKPRLREQARASVSSASDTLALTKNRPILQANSAMRARLIMLLWAWPWKVKTDRRAA